MRSSECMIIHVRCSVNFNRNRFWASDRSASVDIIRVLAGVTVTVGSKHQTWTKQSHPQRYLCVLKYLLEGSWTTKKWPKNPVNAFSNALLMSRFQNFAVDAAKKNCGYFEIALCAALINTLIRGQRFSAVVFFTGPGVDAAGFQVLASLVSCNNLTRPYDTCVSHCKDVEWPNRTRLEGPIAVAIAIANAACLMEGCFH